MKNREQDNLYFLRSMMEDESDAGSILSFGYYLSSKQNHLYNFSFYIDESKNYKEFVEVFRKRYELCNNTLALAKKKYSNLWSDKDPYGIENESVKIEIICDGLFSYSYPMNSIGDDSVIMDKELANSFSAKMINRGFVNIKVIIKTENTDYVDIHKKENVSDHPERDILRIIIKMIKTACCVYIKKKLYEPKKK